MNYRFSNKKIFIEIPATNSGKFRFKTRKNNLEFGEIFSTRKINFNENVYLEWQIGYDAVVKDITNGKKITKLQKLSFIGANGKEKYPYELSELLYCAVENNLLLREDLISLLEEVESYDNFINERKITVEHSPKRVMINGVAFEETNIKLPTFFMLETVDNTQIEVSIQKQQYASGVQPMLYFCIPFKLFNNHAQLIGKVSTPNSVLTYILDEKNRQILLDIFRVFAMCSPNHNFDTVEILKVLIKLLEKQRS